MKITRGLLLSLLAPGVVCLLVAIEVAFGLRGFDDPRGGLAAVLEVPGLLVGWGALFFLVPLLVWLVLDWWGVSFSGIALKCLGATAVSIAVGAMFGIVGGLPAGGHLGAGLGGLLHGALGTAVSFALLAIMALPGLVLTCAGFLTLGEGTASGTAAPAKAKPKKVKRKQKKQPAESRERSDDGDERAKPSLFRRRKKVSNLADLVRGKRKPKRPAGQPWYPETQYDDAGNELPMQFDTARDVGEIRYADPDPEPETEAEEAPVAAEGGDALPTIPELFAGSYDEGTLEERLANDAGEEAPAEEETGAVHVEPAANRVVEGVGRVVGTAEEQEEALMPGVRWAPEPLEVSATPPIDEEVEDEEEWEAEPELEVAEELEDEDEALGRVIGQTPTPAEPDEEEEEEPTPSVKDSVLQALEGEAHTTSSKRYLQKLEASGIFDFMDDEPPKPRPSRKKAARKKAKKKSAKKKAAARKKKSATKKAARKKAAKKPARKTPAATRKASAVRKPASKPAVKKKPSPKATQVDAAPETKRPANPAQWQTGSWRHGPNGIQARGEAPPAESVSESVRRQVIRERRDPRFTQAAEICLERGAASPVLLTRRLGIGYAEAKSLVERLCGAGVLGPVTKSGSYPTAMTPAQWASASQ